MSFYKKYLLFIMSLLVITSCVDKKNSSDFKLSQSELTRQLWYYSLPCQRDQVKELVAKGADVNAFLKADQTDRDETILTLTAEDRIDRECFDIILPKVSKETLSKKNSANQTPIDILLDLGLNENLPGEMTMISDHKLSQLLKKGADFNPKKKTNEKSKLSQVFEQNKMLNTMETLIDVNFANEFQIGDEGDSPISLLVYNNNFKLAKKLFPKNKEFLKSEKLGYNFLSRHYDWVQKGIISNLAEEDINFCFSSIEQIFEDELLDYLLRTVSSFWLRKFFQKYTLDDWYISPVALKNLKEGILGSDVEQIMLRNGMPKNKVYQRNP